MPTPRIILTNDDGIHSPGLWAAAEVLATLGEVIVAAPREQNTAAGRSMPAHMQGHIHETTVEWQGKTWRGYAVDGAPAQVVQHALLELAPAGVDLVVAGINYGENVGSGITISGTVGAALEAASFGLPALAVSLETDKEHHLSHSLEVNFAHAAYFTRLFAQWMLTHTLLPDVDVLKVDVPRTATSATPWRLTRLSKMRYYLPTKPERTHWGERGKVGYERVIEEHLLHENTDVKALLDGIVSVTPLSLDMTARVEWSVLQAQLEK